MSREQPLRSPAARVDTEAADTRLAEQLLSLAMEARQERGTRRAELVDSFNALLKELPSHPAPAQAVPTLHRLQEEGLLEGLVDASGQPATIAVARALVALGYPHALEVSPEQLEALREWEERPRSTPWGAILGILFVASGLQLVLITAGAPSIRLLFDASAAALAGEPVEPTLALRLQRFWYAAMYPAFLTQVALDGGAWLLTLVSGVFPAGLRLARRVFYGMGALGLVVGFTQLPFLALVAMGTFVGAGAALLAGRMLREG